MIHCYFGFALGFWRTPPSSNAGIKSSCSGFWVSSPEPTCSPWLCSAGSHQHRGRISLPAHPPALCAFSVTPKKRLELGWEVISGPTHKGRVWIGSLCLTNWKQRWKLLETYVSWFRQVSGLPELCTQHEMGPFVVFTLCVLMTLLPEDKAFLVK